MAALRSLGTLNTAQEQYQLNYGRFAESLAELGPPPGAGCPTPNSADLIPPNLAGGIASGYIFLMIPAKEGYQIVAWPQLETNGERSFYTDESTVIRAHVGRPAWETDPEIP